MTTGWLFRKPGQYGAKNLKRWKQPIQRALHKNAAMKSLHCTTLHREHAKVHE